MQHGGPWPNNVEFEVSILTGPFGPVQPGGRLFRGVEVDMFQSSPALSGRCNFGRERRKSPGTGFNPHRPFRAGATFGQTWQLAYPRVSILTGPFGPVQR